jgi:hypothetical protein
MSAFLRLFLSYCHTALGTSVCAFAKFFLVLHDIDSLYLFSAVDAWNHDIGTNSLMTC